jgi:hypothetical protein
MSVHAVAGLIKFFSPMSRAGLSTCPGCDLPGQLDGLLRTSFPGKTVTGQDPASLDRLDLFQRGQSPVVILVQKPREQLRLTHRGWMRAFPWPGAHEVRLTVSTHGQVVHSPGLLSASAQHRAWRR